MRNTPHVLRAVFVLLFLLLPSSGQADPENGAVVYKADGEYAYLTTWSDPISCFVYAGRERRNGAMQTFLLYGCFDQTASSALLSGSGTIPNVDLQVIGNHARLRTDTANNSNFHHDVGAGGMLEAEWTKTDMAMSRWTGTTLTKSVGYTYRQRGTSEYASAVANALVPGMPLQQSTYGTIGANKSVDLSIWRQ